MKRRIAIVLIFLLLGAIVNIAVAWAACSATSKNGTIDCMLEWPMAGELSRRSRYADAGICVGQSPFHHRLSISFGSFEGGWREVPDLDAEVPDWVDGFLDDAALATLKEGRVGGQQFVEAGGWPCLSLCGSFVIQWQQSSQNSAVRRSESAIVFPAQPNQWGTFAGQSKMLPLWPIWAGFAINTIFYAVILWLVFTARLVLPRYRRMRRTKRGLCPACAYPVGGSPICTECGGPVGVQR